MKSKFLILGAGGQLGKEFTHYFDKNDIEFFAPNEKESNITDQHMMQEILTKYHPDFVINCAAYNAVDKAEEDPETAFLVNAHAPGKLAELAGKHKARLVHFSSDYVFDGKKNDLYQEQDSCNPLNVYGQSKKDGEQLVLSAGDHLVFRLSWVIGAGEQNFIYKLNQWAEKNPVLKISSDEASVPTFTFDIVKLTLQSLDAGLKGMYHLTSSDYASRYELARQYLKIAGRKNIVVPVPMSAFPTPAKRPLFSAMSNSHLQSKLNIEIPSWQESLAHYVENYL